MRIEQVAALIGEDQTAFVAAKVDGLDKAIVTEMAEGIVVGVELLFGHDSERADGGQRAAVLAIQLADMVAIDDQLALLTARQVEVVHQPISRVVVVTVALLVHAFVFAIPVTLFAWITPSSAGHRSLLTSVLPFGLSVKTPWQFLRGVVQGGAEAPGRFAAAFEA